MDILLEELLLLLLLLLLFNAFAAILLASLRCLIKWVA